MKDLNYEIVRVEIHVALYFCCTNLAMSTVILIHGLFRRLISSKTLLLIKLNLLLFALSE